MRVVTDTNVIVSALLWMGAPQKILIAAEKAQVTLCVSPALLQELVGVLERPKFTQRLRNLRVSATELMSGYVCLAHVVLPQRVPRVVATDVADDEVLACAFAARAKYIVSGDSDLLRMRSYMRIPILSPTAFVRDVLDQL
jgi:uncharacterized protein